MSYYILYAPTDSVYPPAFVLEGTNSFAFFCGSFFSAMEFPSFSAARDFLRGQKKPEDFVIFKKEF